MYKCVSQGTHLISFADSELIFSFCQVQKLAGIDRAYLLAGFQSHPEDTKASMGMCFNHSMAMLDTTCIKMVYPTLEDVWAVRL